MQGGGGYEHVLLLGAGSLEDDNVRLTYHWAEN